MLFCAKNETKEIEPEAGHKYSVKNWDEVETENGFKYAKDLTETDKLIIDENEIIAIQKISKIGNNVFIYI